MYRQYENPRALEAKLAALKGDMQEIYDRTPKGGNTAATGPSDEVISLHESIADLEERVNFAWQDEEYG